MADKRRHNKNPLISNVKERTLQDRVLLIRDWVVSNAKIVFPVIGVAAIAITVLIAMTLKKGGDEPVDNPSDVVSGADVSQAADVHLAEEELQLNAYAQVNALIDLYFNAMTTGDVEVVSELHNNVIKDTTKIRIQELSKYISSYPFYEVYTKPGPVENSYMAYVYYKVLFDGYETQVPGLQFLYIYPSEDGELYIRNDAGLEENEVEYIGIVEAQEDVKELKNRITVENNEVLLDESNGIYNFVTQLAQDVDINVGKILAERVEAENQVSGNQVSASEIPDSGEGNAADGGVTPQEPQDTTPKTQYAKTTSAINVRSSDSMTADKVGKLASGTQVEVLEKLANGWCKIKYEKKEAYVKTDYLSFAEDVTGIPVIGSVTASTNVNVRSEASETAARLGVAREGETYDLLEMLNDWCKIKYEGQVGYIKAEFVTQN